MISLRQTFKSPQTLSHKREKNTKKGKSEKNHFNKYNETTQFIYSLSVSNADKEHTCSKCRRQLHISIQNTLTGYDVTLSMTEVYEEYKNLS